MIVGYDRVAFDETGLEERFRKEATDVVGADKNDLEFRLFLERT